MIIVGVDPGITGGLAIADTFLDKIVAVVAFPLKDRTYGKGKEIDLEALYGELHKHVVHIDKAYIEHVGVMPKQGVVSGFQFGRAVGQLEGMLTCFGAELNYIHPAVWKKNMGLIGTDKEATRQLIIETFPNLAHFMPRKKDHGLADAIAITVTGVQLSNG